ncbi:MAG: N-formylglutamate amidohydrolase [Bacteriovoracales bacterium]|nr:N-formylglutamate amidohydrolase [Bacteriovoracales bacterium]
MVKNAPLFELFLPDSAPLIGLVSIPHAGEKIPEEFLPFLTEDEWALGQDVDFRVDELIDNKALLEKGIAVLKACVHRVACDLNRSPDKAIFNWKENSMGVPLVRSFPDPETERELLAHYHAPYFSTIQRVKGKAHDPARFSLIDLHSMPSTPTAYHLKKNPGQGSKRPDFCLSDLEGKSCAPRFIQTLKEDLESFGYGVLINDPYEGGYITRFAHPLFCDNIQVEINRALYMDEKRRALTPEAKTLKDRLTQAVISTMKTSGDDAQRDHGSEIG